MPPDSVEVLEGPEQAAGGISHLQCSLKSRAKPLFPALVSSTVGWEQHGVTGLFSFSCAHCWDSSGDMPASIHS